MDLIPANAPSTVGTAGGPTPSGGQVGPERAEQLTQTLPVPRPLIWPANLPCTTGPFSGCKSHNPSGERIFHDTTLVAAQHAGIDIVRSLFSRRPANAPRPAPRFYSTVPRDPSTTALLPKIHDNVPYSLSFYHVAAAAQASALARDWLNSVTAELDCNGANGWAPKVHWAAKLRVIDASNPSGPPSPNPSRNTVLAAFRLVFALSGDDVRGSRGYYSKNTYSTSGYRHIPLCPHMTRFFRSIRVKRAWPVDSPVNVRIEYGLRNIWAQEFRDVWDTEEVLGPRERQPQNQNCGLCWTDTSMHIQMFDVVPYCTITVHKDLGSGLSVDDVKWQAAIGAQRAQRAGATTGSVRSLWVGQI